MVASAGQSYSALLDQYEIGEEIGSGGFGKVKLGTHLLTKEKVAIKIIDKKAIGEDLPRVTTELRALRQLWHQNICRLYQFVETDDKFFIVLEYCAGGELFDYIVKKECLPEPEARHFFRQIVAAIAFVHSKGFAHRDLKPENLLLTEDLQVKLIDFGLCANPVSGLHFALQTCCGSPAYAAPELIQGVAYYGNEADVWSMGVLLYALLCGCLPFEDDNINALYAKIKAGRYDEPSWLSASAKDLLRRMLQTEPRRRATLDDIRTHSWVVRDYNQPLKWRSIYDPEIVEEECIGELARYHGLPNTDMVTRVKQWDYDYLTATYFLLLERKRCRQPVVLPHHNHHGHHPAQFGAAVGHRVGARRNLHHLCINPNGTDQAGSTGAYDNAASLLRSPTIHASLDMDLDRSGVDNDRDERVQPLDAAFVNAGIEQNLCFEKNSYARAISNGVGALIDIDAALCGDSAAVTRLAQESTSGHGAKGTDPRGGSLRVRPAAAPVNQQHKTDLDGFATPARPKSAYYKYNRENAGSVRGTVTTGTATVTPLNTKPKVGRAPMSVNTEDNVYESPPVTRSTSELSPGDGTSTPKSDDKRTPRSATRRTPGCTPSAGGDTGGPNSNTPKLSRRMFASVERKVDRVINLLTPRRNRDEIGVGPTVLKKTRPLVNVSSTSTDDAELVLSELQRVLRSTPGVAIERRGWKICGHASRQPARVNGNKLVTGARGGGMNFELEVVFIEQLNVVGIRRKRLQGDAFLYKRVCEQVLNMAQL